jgi:hypothetical protein
LALERRNGRIYYYRSVRTGDRVRKVYVGAGELARLTAQRDLANRATREGERQRERAELEQLEALNQPVEELCEAAEILLKVHLVADGYRRYQGKWRRAREQKQHQDA